jgi:hypothetical protein
LKEMVYSMNAAAATIRTAPTEPATRSAAPVYSGGDVGFVNVAVPLVVPLAEMLAITKDGQAVPSETGMAERVTITSAAADGQSVPQGALIVVVYRIMSEYAYEIVA